VESLLAAHAPWLHQHLRSLVSVMAASFYSPMTESVGTAAGGRSRT
jgi:hypothetical protein